MLQVSARAKENRNVFPWFPSRFLLLLRRRLGVPWGSHVRPSLFIFGPGVSLSHSCFRWGEYITEWPSGVSLLFAGQIFGGTKGAGDCLAPIFAVRWHNYNKCVSAAVYIRYAGRWDDSTRKRAAMENYDDLFFFPGITKSTLVNRQREFRYKHEDNKSKRFPSKF